MSYPVGSCQCLINVMYICKVFWLRSSGKESVTCHMLQVTREMITHLSIYDLSSNVVAIDLHSSKIWTFLLLFYFFSLNVIITRPTVDWVKPCSDLHKICARNPKMFRH